MTSFTCFLTLLVIVLSDQSTRARLEGRITDLSGMSLPGVTIQVTTGIGPIATGQTDAKGEYSIAVPEHQGAATVRAHLHGFVETERTMTIYPGRNLWDVGLAIGHLADPTWTNITGMVTDVDGKPIVGATVTLQTMFGLNEKERLRTDARGFFAIRVAEAVPYVLIVSRPGHTGHAQIVDVGVKRNASMQIKLRAAIR